MIAFVVFVFLSFYISSMLKEIFDGKLSPYGFLRASLGASFSGIITIGLIHLFKLDFNCLGIIKAEAREFNILKFYAFLTFGFILCIISFLIDIGFKYGAKFLDWLYELLSNFFSKKK